MIKLYLEHKLFALTFLDIDYIIVITLTKSVITSSIGCGVMGVVTTTMIMIELCRIQKTNNPTNKKQEPSQSVFMLKQMEL